MKSFRALWILVPLVAAGCSHEFTIVHDEPHVVSETEAHLEANAIALPGGNVQISAFRVFERKIEQDYWRQRKSLGPELKDFPALAGSPAAARSARAVGEQFPLDNGQGEFVLIILAVIAAIIAVAAVVAVPIVLVIGLGYGTDALVTEAKPFDDQRTTIHTQETVRLPCESATIESASGGERLDLGKQPAGGWLIDAATLQRMHLNEASAILRDGALTVTILIPKR
jgi:hypothetical protein